jgi:hypothetical protein
MSTLTKALFILSSIFILIGSFLPWRREGDFISYWTHGIQIYPSAKDNGGFLIVLLTLFVIILVFRPPQFIGNRASWNIGLAIILVLDAFVQVGKLLLDRRSAIGLVGAPVIQVGLVMVLIGSMLLFFSVLLYYFKPQS